MGLFIFLILFLLFALLSFFIIGSAFLGFVLTRVPFIPTPANDVRILAKRLKLSRKDTVLELGSGNGRVAFLLEELTGARVFGYEATLWTHWWAKIAKILRRSRVTFVFGNFFRHHWGHATVIYMYLYPPLMPRIADKILTECESGTIVVSRDFPVPNLRRIGVYDASPGHSFFIYQV